MLTDPRQLIAPLIVLLWPLVLPGDALAQTGAPQPLSTDRQPAAFVPTAQVYAALLEQRYHGTPASALSVKDMTVAMPTLSGSSSEWLKQFDGVPLVLRRAASKQSPTKVKALDASLLPPVTRLVSARAIDATFIGGIEENWAAFRRQFNTRGWLSFSEVLFSEDGLDALVYYEGQCGGLCAEGGFAWLRRDTLQSPWSIAKRIISWEA